MTNHLSSQQHEWQAAKEEIRQCLVRVARGKDGWISYSALVKRVSAMSLSVRDQSLADLLGEISTEEHNAGRGMLSVLVGHKDDQKPGPGFFKLARQLGCIVRDEDEFWVGELNRVIAYWRVHT